MSNSVWLFQAIVKDFLPCACIRLLNMTHSCWFTILCIMSIFYFPDYCINNLILKTQTVFCFILPCLRLIQDKTKRFPSYNNLSQGHAEKIDKFSVSQIVISLILIVHVGILETCRWKEHVFSLFERTQIFFRSSSETTFCVTWLQCTIAVCCNRNTSTTLLRHSKYVQVLSKVKPC